VTIFVTIGNARQPFRRLIEQIERIAEYRAPLDRFIVQHGYTPLESEKCEGIPFLDMETFQERMETADLIVCHCGAGTVIEAIRARKHPVVVPRMSSFGEHVDDHQRELAHALDAAGHAHMVERIEELEDAMFECARRGRRVTETRGRDSLLEAIARDLLACDMIRGTQRR
jgi:beta-1,4-N-acetylglucosaminyltransferase